MGAAGLDYELIAFTRRFLKKCDLPDAVKTGREMFGPDPARKQQKLDPPTYGSHRPSSIKATKTLCSKE